MTGATANTNSVAIQGGIGGVGGAGGATTSFGGNGGNGGDGGIGIFFVTPGASLTNSGIGNIQGGNGGNGGAFGAGTSGNGAAGLGGLGGTAIVGGGLTIINSGTIAGGFASDGVTRANAITFTSGVNSLTIQSGSTILGNVVAVSGGTDTFALGGATNSSFNTTQIGAQYQNFTVFNKTGTSVWTLTGTPGQATPWVISTGTLQAGAVTNVFGATSAITVNTPGVLDLAGNNQQIGSLTGSGTVTNSAGASSTLTTGDATNTVFSGVIQNGVGQTAMAKQGAGLFTLSGVNIYTGGTTINGGTLALTGGGSIANSSGVNVANAASIFDIAGTTTGATITTLSGVANSNVLLGSKMLTLSNASSTYNGVISGTNGALTLAAGSQTLSGINTYTGGTTINGGTLNVAGSIASSSLTTVNSGGTLTGIGTVGNSSIAAGGIFVPGSSTPGSFMNVTGNLVFLSGALYTVNLNPTTSSFSSVAGAATLGGATVNAIFASGGYIAKQYTILNASTVSGAFGSIANTNLPGGFADTVSYDGSHAYLNLALGFTPPSGRLNINQQNVADGLINSFNVNSGIPAVFGSLTPGGLTHLSGEVGASFSQVAFHAGDQFLNLMLNPSFDGHFNTGGFGPIGYADEKRLVTKEPFAAIDRKQELFDSRYGIWGAAFGGGGSIDGNATTGSLVTTNRTYGIATGLDYRMTPDTIVGFALAGGGTNWDLDQSLGSGRSDMFQAGLYGKTRSGAAYLSGAVAYSFHDVTTNRTVTIAGIDVLQADFKANVISGRLEGGYRYATPWLGVTPYGAVQLQSIMLPSYGETAVSGSSQFALNYASLAATTTRTELGVRLDKSYSLDRDAILTLYSRAAWAHDFGSTPNASAIFAALPASNFTVYGAQPAPDSTLVTTGAEYKLASGWSVLAKFDGEFSNTTRIYSGSGTFRKTW